MRSPHPRPLLLTLLLTLPAAAQSPIQPQPPDLNLQNAATFPGPDIGARINAAFASAGPSAHILLPAGQSFAFSTTIHLPIPPENGYPILDCQGSTLHYTGSSDAILIEAGGGAPYSSGRIQDCVLTGTPAAANGIHQLARVGMHLRDVTIAGFSGPSAAGFPVENTRFDGSRAKGGLGWSERLDADLNLFANTSGLRLLGTHGGTNSFGYADLRLRCQLFDGQWCLDIDGDTAGADLYGSSVTIKANATFNHRLGGIVRTIRNGALRAHLTIDAESQGSLQGYALFTDKASVIQSCGSAIAAHFTNANAGVSAQLQLSTSGAACGTVGSTFQPPFFYGNVAQARSSKWVVSNSGVDYFMAAPGGSEPGSPFTLWSRNTSDPADPEADADPGRSTVLRADALSRSVAIGPGFNTARPTHTLEFNGTLGNRSGTFAVDANGLLRQPLHTPATSHEPCTPGQFTDDPSFHYVCTAPNIWKRVALVPF